MECELQSAIGPRVQILSLRFKAFAVRIKRAGLVARSDQRFRILSVGSSKFAGLGALGEELIQKLQRGVMAPDLGEVKGLDPQVLGLVE